MNTYLVATDAESVPSNLSLGGTVIFDPEQSLHYRYGAETDDALLVNGSNEAPLTLVLGAWRRCA